MSQEHKSGHTKSILDHLPALTPDFPVHKSRRAYHGNLGADTGGGNMIHTLLDFPNPLTTV
jgi:hypothetical protein